MPKMTVKSEKSIVVSSNIRSLPMSMIFPTPKKSNFIPIPMQGDSWLIKEGIKIDNHPKRNRSINAGAEVRSYSAVVQIMEDVKRCYYNCLAVKGSG